MRADGAHRLATFTRPPIDSAPAVRVTGQGGAGAGRSRPPASPPAPTRSRSSGTRRKRRHGRTLERTAKAVRIRASDAYAQTRPQLPERPGPQLIFRWGKLERVGRPVRPSVPPKGSPERPDPLKGLPFGSLRSALDRPDNPVMASPRRTTRTTSSPTHHGSRSEPREGVRRGPSVVRALAVDLEPFGSRGCQPAVPVEVAVMVAAGPAEGRSPTRRSHRGG